MIVDSTSSDKLWLKCTRDKCTLNNCIREKVGEGDRRKCQYSLFSMHKITTTEGDVIKVGDKVVLEHKSTVGVEHESLFPSRMFVTCTDGLTQHCSISSNCSASDYDNNMLCQENILTVQAEGKDSGEAITHNSHISFRYDRIHPDMHSSSFCCNSVNYMCGKIYFSKNVLNACEGSNFYGLFNIQKV